MSNGLGRIQRGCLRVIEEYEAAGKRPTTVNNAAEVYRVGPDRLSDAQHVTTERALASLRQKGLVSRQQDTTVYSDGTKGFPHAQRIADTGPAERSCIWSRNGGPDMGAPCSMEAD